MSLLVGKGGERKRIRFLQRSRSLTQLTFKPGDSESERKKFLLSLPLDVNSKLKFSENPSGTDVRSVSTSVSEPQLAWRRYDVVVTSGLIIFLPFLYFSQYMQMVTMVSALLSFVVVAIVVVVVKIRCCFVI